MSATTRSGRNWVRLGLTIGSLGNGRLCGPAQRMGSEAPLKGTHAWNETPSPRTRPQFYLGICGPATSTIQHHRTLAGGNRLSEKPSLKIACLVLRRPAVLPHSAAIWIPPVQRERPMPQSMRAVLIDRFGGPEVLHDAEV